MIQSLDDLDAFTEGVLEDLLVSQELEKVYQRRFASRSEAAQYAARIRWGNRTTPATMPDGTTINLPVVDIPPDPLTMRIADGQRALEEAGFTMREYSHDQLSFDTTIPLRERWAESCKHLPPQEHSEKSVNENMGLKAISFAGTVHKGMTRSLVVVERKDGAIAGMMMVTRKADKSALIIDYMGTSKLVKGTGSAMLGEAARMALKDGIPTIRLGAIDTAVSFWASMGFVSYRKDSETWMSMSHLKRLTGEQ